MTHPPTSAIPGGDLRRLLVLWPVVIAATLIYWEACRLAHGAGTIDLRNSGLWMVEIWSGWLILSFPAYELCRRWSSGAGGLSVRRVLGLMAAMSLFALSCEWLLNLLLSPVGIERWDSAWAMFNRRALLCVVVSGAIVALARRPNVAQRDVEHSRPIASTTLVLTDRTGPVAVPLHDVEAIVAAENYVQVCLASGKEYLHRMPLAKLEQELDTRTMVRVHRSTIVNVNSVRRRLPGWRLELSSGRIVRVGRTFRSTLEQRMSDSPMAHA